jgi:Leucine-rich repeat (LRR) protein
MIIKTDADLAKWVAETPKVKSLCLRDTQVVDLSPLAGLTNLEVLDLCDTQVDQQSLDNLRAALPNVRIYR